MAIFATRVGEVLNLSNFSEINFAIFLVHMWVSSPFDPSWVLLGEGYCLSWNEWLIVLRFNPYSVDLST